MTETMCANPLFGKTLVAAICALSLVFDPAGLRAAPDGDMPGKESNRVFESKSEQTANSQVTADQVLRSADMNFESADYETALRYYRATIELDPLRAKAYAGAGLCYLKLSKKREAYDHLLKASELSPDHAALQVQVSQLRDQLATEGRLLEGNGVITPTEKPPEEQEEFPTRSGPYIGICLPVSSIGEDFDGSTALVSEVTGEWVAVPSVSGAGGYGGNVGWRGFGRGFMAPLSLEVGFLKALKDVRWGEASGEADLILIDSNLKYHFNTKSPLQFYGTCGYSLGWLDVKGGSYYQGNLGDTKYKMRGPAFGAGLSSYLKPYLFVDIMILYRIQEVVEITAADDLGQGIKGGLKGSGMGFKIGINLQKF